MQRSMRPLFGVLIATLLTGCTAHGPTPATLASHPGAPDMSKFNTVEGVIQQLDTHELLLMAHHAPLRFKLSEASKKLVSQGKHLSELQLGDRIKVNVHYDKQVMDVESFELLATAAKEAKKSGAPHAVTTPSAGNPANPH